MTAGGGDRRVAVGAQEADRRIIQRNAYPRRDNEKTLVPDGKVTAGERESDTMNGFEGAGRVPLGAARRVPSRIAGWRHGVGDPGNPPRADR